MKRFLKNIFGKKEKNHSILPQKEQVSGSSDESNITTDIKSVVKSNNDESGQNTGQIEPSENILTEILPYNPDLVLRNYNYPTLDLAGQNAVYLDHLREVNFSLPFIWSINHEIPIIKDLSELKTILITGTQSTGKTTFLHQIIVSLLFKKHPSQLKFVFADVKGIEFSTYRQLEKHFLAKLPGEENSIIEALQNLVITLNGLCIEMDNRYALLKDASVRNIKEYNTKFVARDLNPQKGHQYLPFIVVIIDDLGGFSLSSDNELNLPLQKLINDGYKAGIFIIISTSQFSGNSLPGYLVSLLGQRVVFNLNSKEDYRRFFDTVKLKTHLPQGEFLYNKDHEIVSGKTLLFDFEELDGIVGFIGKQRGYPNAFLLPEYMNEANMTEFDLTGKDSLFKEAAILIVQNQIGSPSLLQRRMKLGYHRAGRIMEQLEAAGIVGPNQGSKARDVLIKTEMELQEYLNMLR